MSATIEERLDALEVNNDRIVDTLARIDEILAATASKMSATAEIVQVLGSYVNVAIETVQQHVEDSHGGE